MNYSKSPYFFVSEYEEHITDLDSVSKIIKAACNSLEGIEVDRAISLLLGADELLSYQADVLHSDLRTMQKNYISRPSCDRHTTAIEADYSVTIPQPMLDQLGWKEGESLEVTALENGTISITRPT